MFTFIDIGCCSILTYTDTDTGVGNYIAGVVAVDVDGIVCWNDGFGDTGVFDDGGVVGVNVDTVDSGTVVRYWRCCARYFWYYLWCRWCWCNL